MQIYCCAEQELNRTPVLECLHNAVAITHKLGVISIAAMYQQSPVPRSCHLYQSIFLPLSVAHFSDSWDFSSLLTTESNSNAGHRDIQYI